MTTTIKLPTIKELREKGWKVRARHYRYFQDRYNPPTLLPVREMGDDEEPRNLAYACPNGGKITLELRDPEGNETKGESVCHLNDNFNKKLGRNLALFRALNIQPPEPKFKVGDKVWTILYMKAREVEITEIHSYRPFMEVDEGGFSFVDLFSIKEDCGTFDEVFATKEELIEFISAP